MTFDLVKGYMTYAAGSLIIVTKFHWTTCQALLKTVPLLYLLMIPNALDQSIV